MDEDIASGRLTPILKDFSEDRGSIWLVWPPMHAQVPRVRAFIDFIAKRLGSFESLLACEATARLLNGAALNAALWVAASDEPRSVLPKAVETFRMMATGLLTEPGND